jgi:hypothetical protein
MKRLLILSLALAFSGGAAAQLYKWKDANGRTRYGDTPPPGVNATQLRNGPASGYAPPSAPESEARDEKNDKSEKNGKAAKEEKLTPEQAFQKRQKERAEAEQKAQKERAEADMKRQNCQAAQTQLRLMESGQRVSTLNAAGEKVFMDDAQRAAETSRAQKAVSDWCS